MILVSINKDEINCSSELLKFSEVLSELNPEEKVELCFSALTINQIISFY
jgi:hypothetical protein